MYVGSLLVIVRLFFFFLSVLCKGFGGIFGSESPPCRAATIRLLLPRDTMIMYRPAQRQSVVYVSEIAQAKRADR